MHNKLVAWGWNARWQRALDASAYPSDLPARITEHHRDRWVAQTAVGPRHARLTRSIKPALLPTAGDWASVEPGPSEADPWTILDVLPRRSAVMRGAAGGEGQQVLAANVDRLWIVHGLDSATNLRRLERYLAIAWDSGATPEVVLTKSDLADTLAESVALASNTTVGTQLWTVSTTDTESLARLRASLRPGQTIALLGPSGAGKSTLLNCMAAREVAMTGAVRESDRKGRHTTTSRQLFRVEGGALFLDTPGLRELKLPVLDSGLSQTFPEIEELAGNCRFRDCSHSSEPGCAVLSAEDRGLLSADRLASFKKLQAEAAYERRKTDHRAKAEQVADMKAAVKSLKQHHPKYRDR